MLTKSEIDEVKDYLNKSENPLFLFDDDADGLCSYLLLKMYVNKGKGVIIKGSPILEEKWLRKVEEISPDLVVVLDKPIISQEFIDKVNVPILWIDHHPIVKRKGVHHYNPRREDENDNSPTTFWVYQITKENIWLAMVGCIGDWYIPDFAKEFSEGYKDLLPKVTTPEDILFNTEFGRLVRMISYILKGKSSDVRKNISVFSRIEGPYEILNEETPKGKFISKYAKNIEKDYRKLLDKALKSVTKDKILLFIYPEAKISFTSDLSNDLLHRYPKKLIIVGRDTGEEVKMSLRSTNIVIPPLIDESLKEVKGYGGGHCLRKDTLIQLVNGDICTAKELKINDRVCSMNLNNYKMKKSFINKKFKKWKNTIIKIKANPYTIECSLDHHIFKFTKDGEIEDVPAKELKRGDFVIGLRKLNIKGQRQKLPSLSKEKAHIISTYNKYKPIKLSRFINKQFCQIYGYLIGDGNIYASDTVEFRDMDIELLKHYNRLIINLFNLKGKIKKIKDKNCYKLRIHSSLLAKLFEKISGGWPKDKHIPQIIKKLPDDELSYFIRGLYDAEGCVGHHEIEFFQKNKRFLYELQLLLLRYGIVSHIRSYGLFISENYSINLFNKKISLTLKRKKILLNKMIKETKKKLRNPKVRFALLNNKQLKEKLLENGLTIRKFFMHPERTAITLDNLKNIQTSTGIDFKKELESDFMLCKVDNIERIKINETLYDFNVPQYNNFIADGLLVHNSHACGANISKEDFKIFIENLKNLL